MLFGCESDKNKLEAEKLRMEVEKLKADKAEGESMKKAAEEAKIQGQRTLDRLKEASKQLDNGVFPVRKGPEKDADVSSKAP